MLTIVAAEQVHIPIGKEIPWYKLQFKRKFDTVQIDVLRTDINGCLLLPSNTKEVFLSRQRLQLLARIYWLHWLTPPHRFCA